MNIEAAPDLAKGRWLALPVFCLLMCLVVRSAWVAEDAYITLRTVDNFIHGYGLRWNAVERVQAYTHPLWMFLLSIGYFFTREAFFTTLLLGVLTTAAAALCLVAQARSAGHALLALAMLCCSRAFIDYGTSGLENPLTHLLIAIFLWHACAEHASLRRVALIAALIACNRSDAVLVVVPTLLASLTSSLRARGLKHSVLELALGLSPLLLWTTFSLFYYGAPFPNTAYAKLNTGIPQAELTRQGFLYLLTSLSWDMSVWISIPMALGLGLAARRRPHTLLALGIVLQLAYVVRVGGDFMAGRFLTMPLFASALLIAQSPLALDRLPLFGSALGSLLAVFLIPRATEEWPGFASDSATVGVVDERAFYQPTSSLSAYRRGLRLPDHPWAHDGRTHRAASTAMIVAHCVGFLGFFSGPKVHIIDHHALTDPLLSRIPARRALLWRIGHFRRELPSGYARSSLSANCHMEDQALCAYWEQIKLITRGELWSLSRLVAIARMNWGSFEHYIDRDRYRFAGMERLRIDELPSSVPNGEPITSPLSRALPDVGIELNLDSLSHAKSLSVGLDGDDDYLLEFRNGRTSSGTLLVRSADSEGMLSRTRAIPKATSVAGFDAIRVLPMRGLEFRLGHLQLSR